ncbi:MAG: hypothetical protein NVS3B21_29090 [Acidimicrobiales bacterium]
MMTDACASWRGLLAAYSLGQVDAGERTAVEAHLEGCDPCRQSLDELGMPTRALASAVSDHVGPSVPAVPAHLGPAIMARVGAARSSRRRRKQRVLVSLVSVAAAATIVVGSLAVPHRTGSSSGERIALSGASGVSGDAVVDRRPWGTQLTVDVQGLAAGSVHSVWLSSADGRRTPAGTFTAVRDRRLRVVLAAAIPPEHSVDVGISDPTGNTVARGRLH